MFVEIDRYNQLAKGKISHPLIHGSDESKVAQNPLYSPSPKNILKITNKKYKNTKPQL